MELQTHEGLPVASSCFVLFFCLCWSSALQLGWRRADHEPRPASLPLQCPLLAKAVVSRASNRSTVRQSGQSQEAATDFFFGWGGVCHGFWPCHVHADKNFRYKVSEMKLRRGSRIKYQKSFFLFYEHKTLSTLDSR